MDTDNRSNRLDAGEVPLLKEDAHARRMRALGSANRVRTARASLKNDLASGRVRLEDVLSHPPTFLATAKVSGLLLAVPGIGSVRTARALASCQIPHARTLTALTGRQRLALIGVLGAPAR